MTHPYWVKVLGSGNRNQRKQLAQRVAHALTTIPTVQPEGVPNRQDRRRILRELKEVQEPQ